MSSQREDEAASDAEDRAWYADQRHRLDEYLTGQRVPHGTLALEPEWCVAPYVALWAVPSVRNASVTFWAISGDLPFDFVPADSLPNARIATRALAERWIAVAGHLAQGKQHPVIRIGSLGPDAMNLAPLLSSRASLLLDWAERDELWD